MTRKKSLATMDCPECRRVIGVILGRKNTCAYCNALINLSVPIDVITKEDRDALQPLDCEGKAL